LKRLITGLFPYSIVAGLGMALLLTELAGVSRGAGVEVLPSQQTAPSLSSPESPPFSSQQERTIPQQKIPPTSSQHEQTIPQRTPQLPADLGSNTREIPLPKVFRGCWSGSVPAVDSIQPLQVGEPPIIWLTKLYTLCYRQTGATGKWELTFADNSVADSNRVFDQRQAIKVKAVTGSDQAELSAFLHFRAESVGLFGIPTGNLNTLDELADLHCRITADREAIEVAARVFVESNSEPYAEMTWHTRLARTSESD
jgi:hypothetical protein